MARTTPSTRTRRRTAAVTALAVVAGLGAGAAWLVPSAGADEPAAGVASPASARDGYTLTTSASQVVVGDTVTMTVGATAATDLYAYDLGITFDPKVLDYVEDSASTDLSGATYDASGVGQVHVVHTKLGSSPTASGPVTLATLSFTALHTGALDLVADELTTTTSDAVETTTAALGTTPVTVVGRAAAVSTAAPALSRRPQVGVPVSVSTGAWSVAGLTYGYQWLRDGAPIAGATGATYTPVPGDAAGALSAVVSAAAPDRVTGSATTAPSSVASAPTTLEVSLGKARKGMKVRATISATAAGIVPQGTVTVIYDGRTVAADRAISGGTLAVRLPAKARGARRVTVLLNPATGFEASVAKKVVRVR